jgi:uncharacterized protein (TIGR02118 family)
MFVKRKPGLTLDQFKDHYENRHAPLAIKLIPQIVEYSRNYIVPDASYRPGHLANVNKEVAPDFDVMSEISFKSEEDYQKMVNTLNDPKSGQILAEDEERFVDRKAVVMYIVDEKRTAPELLGKG